MRFGDFLVREGHILDEQLALGLAEQRRRQIPLGLLAIHTGRLETSAVHRILRAQSHRRSWRRFGDLAVELGLLEAREIDELLARQLGSRPRLGELLVEQRALTSADLPGLLDTHHRRRLDEATPWTIATA